MDSVSDQESGPDFPEYIAVDVFDEANIGRLINGESILYISSDVTVNVAEVTVTYAVYEKLLHSLDEFGFNVQENLPKILHVFNPNFSLPKKISNLTRKLQRDISKKNTYCAAELEAWKATTEIEHLHKEVTHVAEFKIADLLQPCLSKSDAPLTVGTILRLRAFRKQRQLSWSLVTEWMKQLFGVEYMPNQNALCSQWERLYEKSAGRAKMLNSTYTIYLTVTVCKTLDHKEPMLPENRIKIT